jgi:hypothetical protein
MARRAVRYPHDIVTQDIPKVALTAAKHETYRFLVNYWAWQGDLSYLCAVCYLQGALDGAQVQRQNGIGQQDRYEG